MDSHEGLTVEQRVLSGEKLTPIEIYCLSVKEHYGNADFHKAAIDLSPFDADNPMSYEELRDFYISHNGIKE